MIQEKGLGTWTEEDYEHAYRFLTEYHIDEELLNPLLRDNTNIDEKELVQRIADIIENHACLEPTKTEFVLFVDYIRKWLIRKKADVRLSTWEGYEIYVTRHIIPKNGTKKAEILMIYEHFD